MTQRVAILSVQLVPGEKAVRLLPAGEFRSADGSGRPKDVSAWRLDAATAAALIARHQARQSRRVVDYEHQTLMAAQNGQPAPAAGWIDALEWREGDGLYATIEWTPKAAAMVAAQEYRYLSPVFPYDATGRPLDIHSAGLTNTPGLDGLTDLAALTAFPTPPDEETAVNELLKKLLGALGLPETTSEADALAGVTALKAKADEQNAKIAALTAQVGQAPDPAKWVNVATMQAMQTELATLKAEAVGREVATLVDAAMKEGRLLPAQNEWAEALGKTDLAALKSYIAATPANPALAAMQTDGKAMGGGKSTPSDADLAVMKALGLTADEYAKGKIEEA